MLCTCSSFAISKAGIISSEACLSTLFRETLGEQKNLLIWGGG